MFYTIYKITNKVNRKIYIGKHQTKKLNDGYMGSGKHLRYAIEKYGLENFEKEILFIFDNEADMNAKEAELVTEDFVKEDTNYNLCPGGKGGWGYINTNGLTPLNDGSDSHIKRSIKASKLGVMRLKQLHKDETWLNEKVSKQKLAQRKKIKKDGKHWSKGKIKHTEEWKKNHSDIMKEKQGGKNNSQFGTMWITNGSENKKIKKDSDFIPEGWYKGRIKNNAPVAQG